MTGETKNLLTWCNTVSTSTVWLAIFYLLMNKVDDEAQLASFPGSPLAPMTARGEPGNEATTAAQESKMWDSMYATNGRSPPTITLDSSLHPRSAVMNINTIVVDPTRSVPTRTTQQVSLISITVNTIQMIWTTALTKVGIVIYCCVCTCKNYCISKTICTPHARVFSNDIICLMNVQKSIWKPACSW